jgi:hypothetical protein
MVGCGWSAGDRDWRCGGIHPGTAAVDQKRTARLSVPLPTPEDLIIMKAVAHRPRDLADIEGILAGVGDLNLRHIRRWVREFAKVL